MGTRGVGGEPTATKAPRRYANGERRRREIVEAATRVFAEQGFERASLRTIAERAGTNHQTLGHHFASKDEIFQEVLARRTERDREERLKLSQDAPLADIVSLMMRRNAAHRAIIQLDVTLTAEAVAPAHPAHAFIRGLMDEFVAEVTGTLEREQAAGRLRAGVEPAVAARQLAALVEGVQIQWLYDPQIDMERYVMAFVELLRA